MALGGDEETKVKLENGKKPKGKPRVAGSTRGRELRAAAALARFEVKKVEEEEQIKDEEGALSGSETESEYEDVDVKGEAFDLDGSRMRDGRGRGLVKVCEDEDQDDVHVKQEIEELQSLDHVGATLRTTAGRDPTTTPERTRSEKTTSSLNRAPKPSDGDPPDRIRIQDIPQYVEKDTRSSPKDTKAVQNNVRPSPHINPPTDNNNPPSHPPTNPSPTRTAETFQSSPDTICPICSMSNGPGSLLCIACSHVLDISKITRYWRCRSEACRGSRYVNAVDFGRCGVCGARKDGG